MSEIKIGGIYACTDGVTYKVISSAKWNGKHGYIVIEDIGKSGEDERIITTREKFKSMIDRVLLEPNDMTYEEKC